MSGVALAISPHLDDAAFSCGGTLARLAARGWRVVIATLFTASVPHPSGFALACQLDKGLGPEVDYMALRRQEDAAAAATLGAEPVWLPFREAPHRRYGSAEELFGRVRDDDRIVPDLAAAIRGLAERQSPGLLLAPQAVGGHVDHVQTVAAIDAAALDIPTAWWRDFPYAVRPAPAEPCADRMTQLPERIVRLETSDRRAKRGACAAYASQIGFQFGGLSGLDRRLAEAGPIERLRGAAIPGLTEYAT